MDKGKGDITKMREAIEADLKNRSGLLLPIPPEISTVLKSFILVGSEKVKDVRDIPLSNTTL